MTLRTGAEPMDGQPIGGVPIKRALPVLIYHIFDKKDDWSFTRCSKSLNNRHHFSSQRKLLQKFQCRLEKNFNVKKKNRIGFQYGISYTCFATLDEYKCGFSVFRRLSSIWKVFNVSQGMWPVKMYKIELLRGDHSKGWVRMLPDMLLGYLDPPQSLLRETRYVWGYLILFVGRYAFSRVVFYFMYCLTTRDG